MNNETTMAALNRKGIFLMLILMVLAGVAHSQNMFQFPYYQDAEGTQIANAWSIINGGDLTPYTYAYEEAPGGSFALSIWASVSGGLSAFDFSINSGRALMLIIHVFCVGLIYAITKKLSNSDLAAIIAALVFAFSPLVTSLQRRVLVDNIMILWLLVSLYLIVGNRRTMFHYFASAAFFGLAVLTKTSAVFMLPAFIYIIRVTSHEHHRRFANNLWLALSIFIISLYPLYAQMREELFPQGWILGGDFPHVSLLERLLDRGPESGLIFNIFSGLGFSFNEWVNINNISADPIIIYGGLLSTLFLLVLSVDNKNLRPIVAMIVMFMVYLMIGGQVFISDIIMVLPLFAIAVGLVIATIGNLVGYSTGNSVVKFVLVGASVLVMLYPFWIFYSSRTEIYTVDQVDGQLDAIQWVNRNVSPDALLVTDNFAFVELRQTMDNTHHYWKLDTDPDIQFNLLDDNICNIDYLITTPQVYADIETFNMSLMRRAFESSELLVVYPNNGWPIEIRQVSKRGCTDEVLLNSADEASS